MDGKWKGDRFTPGPWAMVPQIFRGIETYKIKGPAKTGPQLVGRIEYEADARLIAEALAMYICLSSIVEATEKQVPTWGLIQDARQIIARASGRFAAAEEVNP